MKNAAAIDAETKVADAPADHKDELRLWLRLLATTTVIETEVRRRLREQFEVTLPRFDLMAQLDRKPAGMTLGELSRRMMVTNGNVTGLVERLVTEGLISRVEDERDRRSRRVRLTEAGARHFRRMARAHENWIADLFGGLKRADVAPLMGLLAKVKAGSRVAIGERS